MIDCEHATAQRVVSLSFPVKLKKKKKKKTVERAVQGYVEILPLQVFPPFPRK